MRVLDLMPGDRFRTLHKFYTLLQVSGVSSAVVRIDAQQIRDETGRIVEQELPGRMVRIAATAEIDEKLPDKADVTADLERLFGARSRRDETEDEANEARGRARERRKARKIESETIDED